MSAVFSASPHTKFRGLACLAALMIVLPLVAGVAHAGEPTLVSLKRMTLEELLNVEVTSVSRAPERLADTASAIQVISTEDIRRSGATSLPQVLRLANNLNVAQKNSHDWGISARGFNTELANKLLVMIDGRTIYTPLFSGVRWDVQDYLLEDISRVEVISGPGGTLWGANAVNGVINIISKSAAETQGAYIEGAAGTQLRHAFAARYGGELARNVHYRVYAKQQERDSQTFANGTDAQDGWNMAQAGFRIDAEPTLQNTLTLQGDYYAGTEGFVGGGETEVSGANLLGRWSHIFSPLSDLRLQLYFDRTHLRQPVRSPFASTGFFTDDLDTYDLDFQHRISFGKGHRLVWGGGYRQTQDRVKPAPGLSFEPNRLRQELFSAFGQIEVPAFDRLSFTLGSKLEHTSYTGFEIKPSVRAQWKLDRKDNVWTSVSRAVRTPSRIDRDLLQPNNTPVILKGDSRFESENVIAYELGYRGQFSSRVAFSAAAFYNVYSKVRSVSRTPVTTFPLYFANDLEGETHGAELTANFELSKNWRILGGYTLLRENIRVRAGGTDLNNALNELSDPDQQVSLRSSADLGPSVRLDVSYRWVGTLRNNNNGQPGTVPSYHEVDARIEWRLTDQVSLSLVGQNLLHSRHAEFGLQGPMRVEIRREVYAKATWRF